MARGLGGRWPCYDLGPKYFGEKKILKNGYATKKKVQNANAYFYSFFNVFNVVEKNFSNCFFLDLEPLDPFFSWNTASGALELKLKAPEALQQEPREAFKSQLEAPEAFFFIVNIQNIYIL